MRRPIGPKDVRDLYHGMRRRDLDDLLAAFRLDRQAASADETRTFCDLRIAMLEAELSARARRPR